MLEDIIHKIICWFGNHWWVHKGEDIYCFYCGHDKEGCWNWLCWLGWHDYSYMGKTYTHCIYGCGKSKN